jgi:hypothetical protein
MEDLSVGSGSIIGNRNMEEFFNHISMHEEVEEESWVELAPSIEVASILYLLIGGTIEASTLILENTQ